MSKAKAKAKNSGFKFMSDDDSLQAQQIAPSYFTTFILSHFDCCDGSEPTNIDTLSPKSPNSEQDDDIPLFPMDTPPSDHTLSKLEETAKKRQLMRRRCQIIGCVLLSLLAAVAATGGWLLFGKPRGVGTTSNEVSSSLPSQPSAAPTTKPTISEDSLKNNVVGVIILSSPTTSFDDPTSPQSQALDWIVTDSLSTTVSSEVRILQRFALATLWFSTNGVNWGSTDGWMGGTSSCNWDHIQCDSNGEVDSLDLQGDGLIGSLPGELGLLSQLTTLDLSNNLLFGSVPSELKNLSHLNTLALYNSDLTGSISSSLSCSAPRTFSGVRSFMIDCGEIVCECCENAEAVPCT